MYRQDFFGPCGPHGVIVPIDCQTALGQTVERRIAAKV
jgi:hypothetical protein